MPEENGFEAIPVGLDLGRVDICLDEEMVRDFMQKMQWENPDLVIERQIVPPGICINMHPRMKFAALPDMKAGIWAKSEHEFIKPMRLGSTITITGRISEKYIKRGRKYSVAEYETRDESGNLLLISRETGVYVA